MKGTSPARCGRPSRLCSIRSITAALALGLATIYSFALSDAIAARPRTYFSFSQDKSFVKVDESVSIFQANSPVYDIFEGTSGGREFRGVPVTGAPGDQVLYAVELLSQGDETVTTFSMQFNPNVVSITPTSGTNNNPDVTGGSGANPGTSRTVNAIQVGQGRIGVLLDFQGALAAGTRQIVVFRFRILPGAAAGTYPITFIDQPIMRSTTNSGAQSLTAAYTPGSITVSSGPTPTPTPTPGPTVTPTPAAGPFTVTNTDDSGAGSLRQAITDSNTAPGNDTIAFNIPGSGVRKITPLSSFALITGPVTIDGTTQPGWSGTPIIEISGENVNATGLSFQSSNNRVKGLVVNRFQTGIFFSGGSNNIVEGNYIGIDAAGSASLGNNTGVVISGGADNVIGGLSAAARNIISGNFIGVLIDGSSSANQILGNFIGTNAAGTAALENIFGVNIDDGSDNVIGGAAPGARNIISGNRANGVATRSGRGHQILGNYIGLGFTGVHAVPNGAGVGVSSSSTIVGGTTAAARNVISGNNQGVSIQATGGSNAPADNVVQGNYIGTDPSGTSAIPNGAGVFISSSGGNTIGGPTSAHRNVISGNSGSGVDLARDTGGPAVDNFVAGNYIGTDASGNSALPNRVGVTMRGGATGNTIGGAGRNLISGNLEDGVRINDSGGAANANAVVSNYIGTNAAGASAIANGGSGILLHGVNNNRIGGADAGNLIAFNGHDGVTVSAGTGNAILVNSIFSNGTTAQHLGIDLGSDGVTANDAGDADFGANNLQNAPVLTSVLPSGGNTLIQGTLNSAANAAYRVEFFNNAACETSGRGGSYLGFTSLTTDAAGNAVFDSAVPRVSGGFITSTATRLVSGVPTDTSEFSACLANTGGAGTFQFGFSGVTVVENAGTAAFTVTRTGGASGAVSVQFSTANESAFAAAACGPAADYITTTGILNFASGEVAKTINVPICNDNFEETTETASITLSNATGGAAIGAPRTAILSIINVNPAPMITSISPSTITDRHPPFEMTIDGANFVSGSVARLGILVLARRSLTPTRIVVIVPQLFGTGTSPVTVENPSPGGGVSNSVNFTRTPCQYSSVVSRIDFPAAGGTGSLTVSTTAGCRWSPVASDYCMISGPGSTTGPATVSFTVLSNGGVARDTTLLVAGQTVTINQAAAPGALRAPFDFDGDGRSDLAVFRPSTGTWFIQKVGSTALDSQPFGLPEDIPTAADFDGDGRTDIAVFRPSNQFWYRINSSDGSFAASRFGSVGDIPVPADYDGDGRDDIAVFRPSSGTWYTSVDAANNFGAVQFGTVGDSPRPADYDGDGRADIAVYRRSNGTWYGIRSSNQQIFGRSFGLSGDMPVPADYDGDGRAELAVFRPSAGLWYRVNLATGAERITRWGQPGDLPVPADYNGDKITDLAVYRPSNGIWYIWSCTNNPLSSAQQFGLSTDRVIPFTNSP